MTFDFDTIKPYLIPAAFLAFLLYRQLRYRAVAGRLDGLAREGAVFVDVRTPAEFAAGSRPGAVNIPLDDLSRRAGELDKKKPVVLCCASGARSGMAARTLRSLGFNRVVDAGPWRNTL